ncbi:integrase [Lipingzhangella halophila]|uniref:Integrase n=1 Tax=Lipingzhangella halophila TaxID=1783352 RepID=A0A7W7W4D9_9ACTN|nr:integrase [Lipingzhangella halophila]
MPEPSTSPCGTRWNRAGAVFTGARGGQLRRGVFRARFWRPAWDGQPQSEEAWLRSPLLPGFPFNEGRHTHRTWLADDGVPEVARAARLGHRMAGRAGAGECCPGRC